MGVNCIKMEIRKAVKKDLREIVEVFRIESAKKPHNNKRTPKKALERVKEYFKEKDIYVSIIDHKIIGFIISDIDPDAEDQVYIDELWILKEHQGKGIGKLIGAAHIIGADVVNGFPVFQVLLL